MESVCTGFPFLRPSLNCRGTVLAVMLWIWNNIMESVPVKLQLPPIIDDTKAA